MIIIICLCILCFIIGRISKKPIVQIEQQQKYIVQENTNTPILNTTTNDLSLRYSLNCRNSEIRLLKQELQQKNQTINELNSKLFNNYQDVTKYNDLLKKPEWKLFRSFILRSKGTKCEHCGSTGILNIHHLRYYCNSYGKKYLPWEYSVNDVKVLCESCHKQEHETNEIQTIKV